MLTVICDPCHGKGVSAYSCKTCRGHGLLYRRKCCNNRRSTCGDDSSDRCACCVDTGVVMAGTLAPIPRVESEHSAITSAKEWERHASYVAKMHREMRYSNNGLPGTSEAPK